MSSSRVMYHGLQSCLEQNSGDARVLNLKLAFPKSNLLTDSGDLTVSVPPVHQQPNDECETNLNNMGGWSFLQSLSQPKESAAGTQKVYVHPLTKRSASTLSKQSLEMCTESLGSETGSVGGSDIDSLSLDNENENGSGVFIEPASRSYRSRKNLSRNVSFPPPLTSMSCSNGGVQMKTFREGGRLVLKAVPSPSVNTYFHAERSDGRLRLRMVNDPIPPTENEGEPEEEDEQETFVLDGDEEEEEESFGFEDDEEEEEEDFEEEDEESFDFEEEGNVEVGMEKLSSRSDRRSGRCNEVRLPQLGWEPFWVAT